MNNINKRTKHISGLLRTVSLILTFILTVALFMMPVPSEAKTEGPLEFGELEEQQDITIVIEWDNEEPKVFFTSPSGNVYNVRNAYENTSLEEGDNALYFTIRNAEPGLWFITYDSGSNDYFSAYLQEEVGCFYISEVYANMRKNDICEVTFTTVSNENRYYHYEVYLTADQFTEGELVSNGSGYTNETVKVSFDMSSHGSYDKYLAYVKVFYTEDEIDVFDNMVSAPFSYENNNVAETKTKNLRLEIRPDEYTVTVFWSPEYNMTYLPAFFAKKIRENSNVSSYADDADYYEEITDTNTDSLSFIYNLADEIKVYFSEKRNYNPFSNPRIFTVDLNSLPVITFEDGDVTNHSTYRIHYSGFTSRTLLTISNGAGTATVFAEGEGDFEAEIPEYTSTLTVSYSPENDVTVIYEKEITRDTTPPALYMSEDYSGIRTDKESFTITGTVRDCYSLTVGGQEVTPDASGNFSYSIPLSIGTNEIDIIASDVSGNSTLCKISIIRTTSGSLYIEEKTSSDDTTCRSVAIPSILRKLSGKMQLIIGGAALLTAAAIAVISTIMLRKNQKSNVIKALHRLLAVFLVVSLIITGYFIYAWRTYYNFNTDVSFTEIIKEDADEAYSLLKEETQYKNYTIISSIVSGGLVALIAVLMFAVKPLIGKTKNCSKKEAISVPEENTEQQQ